MVEPLDVALAVTEKAMEALALSVREPVPDVVPDSVALLHGDGVPVADAHEEAVPLTLTMAELDAGCVPDGVPVADEVPVTVDVALALPV